MPLNAYINDFSNKRSLNEKCSVCRKTLQENYFTLPTHDDTRAYIKENRMCSKRCMNSVTLVKNSAYRSIKGKSCSNSDSDM